MDLVVHATPPARPAKTGFLKTGLMVIGVVLSGTVLSACSQVPDAVNPAEWYKGTVDFFAGEGVEGEKKKDGKENGLIADRGKALLKERKPLAEQGDASAQYNLGLMYDKGEGVPQDYKTAVKWYTLAAEQGFADAQSNLGLMYALGQGVIQDSVYAHMWWNIAASQGDKDGTNNRDIAAKKMTPADLSKAQDLARECVRKKYKGC